MNQRLLDVDDSSMSSTATGVSTSGTVDVVVLVVVVVVLGVVVVVAVLFELGRTVVVGEIGATDAGATLAGTVVVVGTTISFHCAYKVTARAGIENDAFAL